MTGANFCMINSIRSKLFFSAAAKKTARTKAVNTIGKVAERKAGQTTDKAIANLKDDSKTAAEKYPVPASLENIQIGPYAYKATGVAKGAFDAAKTKGFNRVKPSKWSAALKQINVTEVHRKLITKTKYDYFVAIGGKYYRYQQLKSK